MSDKIQSINTPISFTEIKTIADDFVKTICDNGNLHIISEIVLKEFREYYTPNIPYKIYSGNDEEVYIKNGTFEIVYPDDPAKFVSVHIMVPGSTNDVSDIISFREFIYVYCNPEGIYLLEKIGFIIENTDFEQEEERRNKEMGIPEFHPEDYEDDIPF